MYTKKTDKNTLWGISLITGLHSYFMPFSVTFCSLSFKNVPIHLGLFLGCHIPEVLRDPNEELSQKFESQGKCCQHSLCLQGFWSSHLTL